MLNIKNYQLSKKLKSTLSNKKWKIVPTHANKWSQFAIKLIVKSAHCRDTLLEIVSRIKKAGVTSRIYYTYLNTLEVK